MNSKITNTEKEALLLKRVNDRPNSMATYGKAKLDGTQTKDLFDKQFELVVQRHNALCDDVLEVEKSFEQHKTEITESIAEQDTEIEAFGETVNELSNQVSTFDERVTDLEDRAGRGEFKGDTGRGIEAGRTRILFAVGGSKVQPPSEDEYASNPSVANRVDDGNYLWIKIVYEFTDGTEEAVITPVRYGKTGGQGPKGDPFGVSKVYHSIDEMNAGFATDGLPEGSFVMIETGNVEDADNAKVYVKESDGYHFIVDLSGSPGIKGADGYTPIKGKDYFTPDDISEIVQEVINTLPNGDEVSY